MSQGEADPPIGLMCNAMSVASDSGCLSISGSGRKEGCVFTHIPTLEGGLSSFGPAYSYDRDQPSNELTTVNSAFP